MSCRTMSALLITTAALAALALAQAPSAVDAAQPADQPPPGHLERPNLPYLPVPPGTQATSPGQRVRQGRYVSVQVNVDSNGNNILGDAANEPALAVNPLNPHNMVIGWRQFDTVNSDFRQAGWAYTFDGGLSWTFPGKIDPGVFRSDPVLDASPAGVFFYNSLTADSSYHTRTFRSYDGGQSWDAGVESYGGDKQWQTIDPTAGPSAGNIYAYWTEWYSSCNGQFTRSYNDGNSYLPCTSIPGSPNWGVLDVGGDGTLYCIGDGFLFAKSTTLKDPNQPAAWQLNTTINLGGSLAYGEGPNPGGLLGQAWLAVDRSGGPTNNYLYALASVDPAGADPLDVMFARSTNGGQSWSTPVRLNDDPAGSGAWQWFGTMDVAPNGRLDVIWNDTRNHPGSYLSEVFYTHSADGGLTWSPNEQLTPAFNPLVGWPVQNKIGDYYRMRSDLRGANLAFAATFNNEEDVYYMRLGQPLCSDAGTVELDRGHYGCEDTAGVTVSDCGLNTNNDVVETVTINVASTSEPAGEAVLLTETGPATAQFTGTVPLSTANAPGVVLVAPGDTLTATYIDADDGEGHQNVVVTTTAVIDCTPPVISNVHTVDLLPHSVTVAFNVDEPVRGTVHYGVSCGNLNQTAASGALNPWPQVDLSGLNDDTPYYFAVEAADEAGNVALDDNGGACYTFTTPQVPDYYTELFSGPCDLGQQSLSFTPNGSGDFYLGCVESIATLPTDPAGGTTLALSDDSSVNVSLGGGATVAVYGVSYTHFYVGSNGYITFNSGDSTYTPTLAAHFNQPRISALFDDLNPATGGSVSWKQLSDRVAVTWLNVPEVSGGNSNTAQIELYFNGVIKLNYLGLTTSGSLAGLSAGGGTPPGFYMSDLSAMGPCQTFPPNAQDSTVNTDENTPVDITLVATDDGMPYPPGALTYIITSLPSHGGLADPGAGEISSVPYTLVSGGKIVRYTPAAYYVGNDSFQFKANDSGTPPDGGDSNIAAVTINVIGVPELVYSFPLDTNPGWTVTGAWAFGHPLGLGSHNKDPNNGHTGTNVYGYNLAGDYGNGLTPKYLTTAALDCSTLTGVEVRFWRWLGVEAVDHAGIEVSSDGSTWTQVWTNISTISEAAWSQQTVALGSTADHQATVYVRWVMGPTDVSVTYPGWNIDDIEIWALVPPPYPIGDMNCDSSVDFGDINPFVLALTNPSGYATSYPDCNIMNADINQDGSVDFGDINPFVQLLTGK
jgi:hypothetical protein